MRRLCVGAAEEIEVIRTLLADAGIECRVLDVHAARAAGAICFHYVEGTAQLWLLQDDREPAAQAVLQRYLAGRSEPDSPGEPWVCPTCHEIIDGKFAQCWRCAAPTDPGEQVDLPPDHGSDPRQDPDALCEECGYHLFGLPGRRCPECGTEF